MFYRYIKYIWIYLQVPHIPVITQPTVNTLIRTNGMNIMIQGMLLILKIFL